MTDENDKVQSAKPAGAQKYDPNRQYEVQLTRVVEYPVGSRHFYRPTDHHVMIGSVCEEIDYAIASTNAV